MSRADVTVAVGFVLAAIAEDVVRYHATPALLVLNATGALWLGALAVRRRWPLVPVSAITAAGIFGTIVTALFWPDAPNSGGVWIMALMLASYSVGAHVAGRSVLLGVLLPFVLVVSVDVTTMTGWQRISGILFVTLFVGVLPTAVGRMVRIRKDRVQTLCEQQARIVQAQRAQQESAVLAERLRTAERLQPTLADGLEAIAIGAASDPGEVETLARDLLTRTREEVVALTAPVDEAPLPAVPAADHVRALRAAAQPWVVLAAAALVAGLSLETSSVLDLVTAGWVVLPASVLVASPLVLAWRWPVGSVALAWVGITAYSRLVAPLDNSLSEAAFGLAAAFAVALLSSRRTAVVGLVVCWVGQLVGVGTNDPLGEAFILLLAWLGGLAVNEVSKLVEQTRVNNELLSRQEAAAGAGALVEERLRLAREIHDAIGHSLTVVALQAGAARRLTATDPDRARDVMRTVADVARSGVATLVLDDVEADVGVLVERVRSTGLAVDADLAGESLLDPVQRVVAFRVVQEGLTNVLRHAPGACVTVAVRQAEDGVEVLVGNSAPVDAGPGPGTGRGLAGIRERVTAHDGRVEWRPREDGGFELRAVLPVTRVAVPVS